MRICGTRGRKVNGNDLADNDEKVFQYNMFQMKITFPGHQQVYIVA